MNKKLLAAVFSLGLVLRTLAIVSRPIWYDEAFAILMAESGLSGLMEATVTPTEAGASNIHPLGYFIFLWGWMEIFGQSAWSVRGLSIILGMVTLVLVYLIGRELFDSKTALIQTFLVAISPFHIHFSQEIRMYSPLAFFLVMATYALWKGIQTQKRLWWALLSISVALAQYTHHLAIIFLIPLALTPLLMKDWRSLRNTVISCVAAIILYFPWLIYIPQQLARMQSGFWVPPPGIAEVFSTLIFYITHLPQPMILMGLAFFTVLACIVLGLMLMAGALKSGEENAWRGAWLAYLAFVPPLFLFTISQWQPVYIERVLLPSGVIFMLWLGWFLTLPKLHKLVRNLLLLLIMVSATTGIYQHITYRGFPYGPYIELGSYLKEQVSQNDKIVHSNKLTLLPMIHYYREMPQEFVQDLPGSGSDVFFQPTQRVLGVSESESIEDAAAGSPTVWLIIFSKAIDEYTEIGYPTHPQLAWLEENYNLVRIETWDDILLYRYEK
jgi:4-amino-4-deoxy-L-arabinose transferase-like glycosyltransferase